jgi:predicted nucleic acid-binding protein
MKKLKIYLDTSVISHLDAPDVPDKETDTKKLWGKIKISEFEAFISPVVAEELERCSEPKRSVMLEYLHSVPITVLQGSVEVAELTAAYIEAGILRQKSFDDCQHIAYACVYGCDIIVSWNFKHIVNHQTISGVKSVNVLAGYKEMLIYSPTMLIEGGSENET